MAEKLGEFYYTVTADGKVAVNEMNKVEREMTQTGERIERRVKNAFSRMFGIGALIATALTAVRAFYRAIADGVGRAIEQNAVLKMSMQNISDNMSAMFTRIGMKLTPILEKLAPFMNLIGQMTGQNILVQNANTTQQLEDLRKWTQYWIDSGKLNNKELEQHKDILTQIDLKYQIIAEREREEYKVNMKNRLEVEKLITAQLDKEVAATGEVFQNVRAIAGKMLEFLPTGKASEFANTLNDMADKFQAIGAAMDKLKDAEGNINFGDVAKSKDVWAIIVQAIAAVADMINSADMAAREFNLDLEKAAIANTYANYLGELRDRLEDLLDIMIEVDFQVDIEKRKRNLTEDDYKREAESIKESIKAKQEYIDKTKQMAEQTAKDYGISGGTANTNWKAFKDAADDKERQAQAADASAAYWRGEIEKWRFIAPGYADSLWGYVRDYEKVAAGLRGQRDVLQETSDAMKTAKDYEGEIIDLGYDLTDLTEEQLAAQQKITDELRAQTEELLRQKAALGIYDVENYGDIIKMLSELRMTGLSGLDLLSAGSGMGISNQAMRNTRIGSMIYNVYQGSNNSASLNGVLNTQTGA